MASAAWEDQLIPIAKPIFGETLGTKLVTLIVRPKRKTFAVHKKLICDSCDYFRKAFCGPFKEAEEGNIYLEEDSADAMGLFVEWLYRGRIDFRGTQAHFNTLIKLYLLTEKWCFYDLGNNVMENIIRFFWEAEHESCNLPPNVVNHIWNETEEKSPLRRLCIERLVWDYWDQSKVNITPDKTTLSQIWSICKNHHSFFCEFFAYYQNLSQSLTPSIPGHPSVSVSYDERELVVKNCAFHRHDTGEECKKPTKAAEDKAQSSKGQSDDFFAELNATKNTNDES
ncbi:hypothetical protein BOTCAL_0478g00030 [Botryotinia calthae]|uniref:BTB domain-containing protein n=1 Tax=Botryotinia calthae TaxID=38488 RepID=A0A4Y8CMS3_9HELO|nr:hypothetical protein BOTCAL_0478g00030 [Botryotinia calthae]